MNILEYLNTHRLLADGAFGTYYREQNGEDGIACERANLEVPSAVKRIHREYMEAGARLLRTNTFAANRILLKEEKQEVKRMIQAGYHLAQEAAQEFMYEYPKERIFIAADIGPLPEIFPEESEKRMEEYFFLCDTFLECKADLFLFETFSDLSEIEPVIKYLKEQTHRKGEKECSVMVEFCVDRYGYSKAGIHASRLFGMADAVDGIDIIGFNCGVGPAHLYDILKHMTLETKKKISVMPNSGYPELLQDRAVYFQNPEYFAKRMMDIAKLGVNIIGGCCGTTPRYIRRMREELLALNPSMRQVISEKKEEQKTDAMKKNEFLEKLKAGKKVMAVELDPPYHADFNGIMERAHALKAMGVDVLTFADSPMARPRMDSILSGVKVRSEVMIPVMPHISCRDKNRIAIRAQLLGAYCNGIRNILVVTGDPIPGSERGMNKSVFDFNSIRLMEYIREMNIEHFKEDPILYGGALNYARANLKEEMERMHKKIQAGASYFLTQPIFSEQDIERILVIKKHVDTKILCGIMPLVNYKNASFVQNEITGIHVPEDVVQSFSPDMTREEAQKNGVRIAASIMKKLDGAADGYYFMLPFNRVSLIEDLKREVQL